MARQKHDVFLLTIDSRLPRAWYDNSDPTTVALVKKYRSAAKWLRRVEINRDADSSWWPLLTPIIPGVGAAVIFNLAIGVTVGLCSAALIWLVGFPAATRWFARQRRAAVDQLLELLPTGHVWPTGGKIYGEFDISLSWANPDLPGDSRLLWLPIAVTSGPVRELAAWANTTEAPSDLETRAQVRQCVNAIGDKRFAHTA